KQAAKAEAERKPVDPAARRKRMAQREERIRDGIERLQLWMNDLIQSGFAGLDSRGESFFEDQARRLIDAQAPGLANRIRRLAEIPQTDRSWPEKMLASLGQLELLLLAYQR